jgi:hypothetical protein
MTVLDVFDWPLKITENYLEILKNELTRITVLNPLRMGLLTSKTVPNPLKVGLLACITVLQNASDFSPPFKSSSETLIIAALTLFTARHLLSSDILIC